MLHQQQYTVPAVIRKLRHTVKRSTGEVLASKPKVLLKNTTAVVTIRIEAPVCFALYAENKSLGRFLLRYAGKTIAMGIVTRLK